MVIDTAELCRHVHPDEAFRTASDICVRELSSFIQQLNSNETLYKSLIQVTQNQNLMYSLTEEQQRMAILLQKEYERDGIHCSKPTREKIMSIRENIMRSSMEFQRIAQTARRYVQIPGKYVRLLPHSIQALCEKSMRSADTYHVPTDVHVVNTVLKCVSDPNVRREMYISGNHCAIDNEAVLEELQEQRHLLARLLQFESYAHFAMDDRMLRSPEKAAQFVENLSKQLMTKAKREKQWLLETKWKVEGGKEPLEPYDVSYYMGMLKAQTHRIDSRVISSFFPLEQCLKGLHLICSELFGLALRSVPMGAGESWHADVQKYELIQIDQQKILGSVYFDLYPRASKYTHAAHFTIRCGKKLSSTEYQKPIIALVCNFNKPAPNAPSLLAHSEVETLFHEFGHALHSLLSQTEFQHLSGTRAQLDFVEMPAHVFEYFAWDTRVVAAFSAHYATGETIPKAMMQGLRESKNMFSAMDTQTQCLYSLFDLTVFGQLPMPFDPPTISQAAKDIASRITVNSDRKEMHGAWHLRFGHLIGYGAGYYSYLYAKMFASNIWHTLFAEDPLSRDAGKALMEKVMVHGGARDPSRMLEDLMGQDSITDVHFLQELGTFDSNAH